MQTLAGTHVVLFTQVPVLAYGDTILLRDYATWRWKRDGRLPTIAKAEDDAIRERANEILIDVARTVPDVEVLHADRAFTNPDGSVAWVEGRRVLYFDDDHLSEAGAERVRPLLERALR